jgi:hypothetical protein
MLQTRRKVLPYSFLLEMIGSLKEKPMTNENQETEEEYLELERYIEELEAGHAPQPPTDLTPQQRQIYRMAAFFCSPFPRAVLPRPEFVEALLVDLLARVTKATDRVPAHICRAAHRRTRFVRTRGVRHHRPSSYS